MLKSFFKKTCVALLSATVLISSFGTKVSAASYVSGSVDGLSTYGSLSMGSTSASATTGSSGAAGHYVSVEYVYKFGTSYYTVSSSSSNSATVTTTANSNHAGSVSQHAYGTHRVSGGSGSTWTSSTSI